MDLLVSRFNNKLDKFVARTRDHLPFAMDVLVSLWGQVNLICLFSSASPSSLAMQDRGGRHFCDSHCTIVAQESMVFRLCRDTGKHCAGPVRSCRPAFPSCFNNKPKYEGTGVFLIPSFLKG